LNFSKGSMTLPTQNSWKKSSSIQTIYNENTNYLKQ
jgi:hypothetical protein